MLSIPLYLIMIQALGLVECFNLKKIVQVQIRNTWLKDPSFSNEVKEYWSGLSRTHLLLKLISVSSFMVKWVGISSTNFEIK